MLEAAIEAMDFWNRPTSVDLLGFDGAQWIVEVATSNRYHVVDRWDAAELEPLGRQLLELSTLDPEPLY